MDSGPVIILFLLALPWLAAVAGLLAGRALLKRFRPSLSPLSPVPIAFAVVLGAAAVVSNSHQTLYDLGLSFPNINILQIIIYGFVGFSVACLWWASQTLWFRGAVVVLVLASFLQPLLWITAIATWTIGGFAP